MRNTIAIAVSALVLAACGQAPIQGPQKGDHIVYEAFATTVAMIDVRTHDVLGHLPLGVPSADWKHYYVVSGGTLQDLDPRDGSVQRVMSLPVGYALPVVTASGMPGGLSPNGQWLVLQGVHAQKSSLLEVNTSFTQAPARIDLDGNFEFDAVNNGGQRVYLIQHAGTGHYYVRDYQMYVGLDGQIIFDKSDGALAMSGLRLMGVPSPGGETLYSVYARKDQSAFIHQLSLEVPIATCIDLSGPGYGADAKAMRWTLALTRDGGRLFATNGALGVVTVLDLTSNGSRTVPLDGGAMGTSAGSTLTGDGTRLVIAGAGGVRWLETSTLHTVAAGLQSWNVTGIVLGADGRSLYAVDDSGRIAQLDSSGHTVTSFDPGLGPPIGLMSVQLFS